MLVLARSQMVRNQSFYDLDIPSIHLDTNSE
jgi:hypothetical protein